MEAKGLSEVQKAIESAGLDPNVIKYPGEVSLTGVIAVLVDENKALTQTVNVLVKQRNELLTEIPHDCQTCSGSQNHASDKRCWVCANEANRWRWKGFEEEDNAG